MKALCILAAVAGLRGSSTKKEYSAAKAQKALARLYSARAPSTRDPSRTSAVALKTSVPERHSVPRISSYR